MLADAKEASHKQRSGGEKRANSSWGGLDSSSAGWQPALSLVILSRHADIVQGQLQYLARRPTSQVTLGEAGRRGRTGYGFTRDSLEDLGIQPQRRSRGGGPSLKQGRSRPVPQILELEEDGEEYDGEYDDYGDEYAYSDEEEEELVWPHEVRPARTRAEPRHPPATTTRKPPYSPAQQYPRREEEVEGRRSFPQVSPPPKRRQPPPRQPGGQGEGYRRGTEEMVEEEGCGPECRNLLHEVMYPDIS